MEKRGGWRRGERKGEGRVKERGGWKRREEERGGWRIEEGGGEHLTEWTK